MFSVVEDEASKQINKEKKIIDKEEALQSILRKIFCCCAIMLDSTECIDIVVQFLVTNYANHILHSILTVQCTYFALFESLQIVPKDFYIFSLF